MDHNLRTLNFPECANLQAEQEAFLKNLKHMTLEIWTIIQTIPLPAIPVQHPVERVANSIQNPAHEWKQRQFFDSVFCQDFPHSGEPDWTMAVCVPEKMSSGGNYKI